MPKGAVSAGGQEIADQALQALIASGRTLGEAKARLSDPDFQSEVLGNLKAIETLYKTSPELITKAQQGLIEKNISVKLPSITNDKLALDRVSDINKYLQEHPEQGEAVGIVLAAAQGPKGLLMWAAQKALGETSVGQAVAQVKEELQAQLGRRIAEAIEGKPLDANDELGAWRLGGGSLMAGILIGSAEGAVAGKVITSAKVGSSAAKGAAGAKGFVPAERTGLNFETKVANKSDGYIDS